MSRYHPYRKEDEKSEYDFTPLMTCGYQVIPNVLSARECETLKVGIKGAWDSLKPPSLKDCKKKKPVNLHGIVKHYQVGHWPEVWSVRQHMGVYNVFAQLWDSRELTVSYDGLCYKRAPEFEGRNPRKSRAWWHFDQGAKKIGYRCTQGFVTLNPLEEGDDCLMVFARSHLYHTEFMRKYPNSKGDFVKLSEEQVEWLLDRGCEPVRVAAPLGSLILWDSRTCHMGGTALKGRANPKDCYKVYVCYQPFRMMTQRQRAKKLAGWENLRTTSHWPLETKLNGLNPQWGALRTDEAVKPRRPKLGPLGLKMVGLKKWSE